MKRFGNVLAIYGLQVGSEETLLCAQDLAKRNGARLTVAEAVERLPGDVAGYFLPWSATDAANRSRLIDECRSRLDRVVASLREGGLDVRSMILVGKPIMEIVRAVLRDCYDLVLIPSELPLGLRRADFGGNATQLLRKCPCPVWAVRQGSGRRLKHIVAAVDPAPREDGKSDLDVRVLEIGASLARVDDARLDIVNAWNLAADDAATNDSEVTRELRQELARKNLAVSEAAVRRILEKVDLNGVSYHLRFPQGNPVAAISAFARENASDLIVMGTESRARINRWLMGNTAEDVLQRVDCSVLTVKPQGFVTPVRLDFEEASPRVSPAR